MCFVLIINVLENSPNDTYNGHHYESLSLAKSYYNSCINKTKIEEQSLVLLTQHLSELFNYGLNLSKHLFITYNLTTITEIYKPLIEIWGLCPLFSIGIDVNLKNTSQFIIEVI